MKCQKEKTILYINTYTWNLERCWDDITMRQQKRYRYEEQALVLWEKVRMGWFRENSETCILPAKIDLPVKFDVWNRSLKASAGTQPRRMGWDGSGGGFGVGDTSVADSCLMYIKNNFNIIKVYPSLIKTNYFF